MKRTLVFLLCVVCASFYAADEIEEKIVQFSRIEWDSVKKTVDTNGYCRVENQNVVLVITNGLPDIEMIHHLPIGRMPEKRILERPRRFEPLPYVD